MEVKARNQTCKIAEEHLEIYLNKMIRIKISAQKIMAINLTFLKSKNKNQHKPIKSQTKRMIIKIICKLLLIHPNLRWIKLLITMRMTMMIVTTGKGKLIFSKITLRIDLTKFSIILWYFWIFVCNNLIIIFLYKKSKLSFRPNTCEFR